MSYQLYWGDLHSHCSVSYGHGTVEQAILRARSQLDFCSVTGHAFWPDMPTSRERYADIIDYHEQGFARLAANWNDLLKSQRAASVEGTFLAFPSYEWHSLKYGDHNIYTQSDDLRLQDAADVKTLREIVGQAGSLAIPHHIGYAAGYRGINWDHFSEDGSPFVEIFSLHGCSLSDESPYPMLHDMGPRDHGSTAVAGWDRGFRFGIVGGTDHHGAYPGSWGDGRMGVYAEDLTRESLWRAFQARRVFAATGDRIDARLFLDDAWIGSVVNSPKKRRLKIDVNAADSLDTVDLLKNDLLLERFRPLPQNPDPANRRWKLRITWGWGPKDQLVSWEGELGLSVGEFLSVQPCFRGEAVVAPKQSVSEDQVPDDIDLPHEILSVSRGECHWRSRTRGNLTMRHATTQSLSCQLDADLDCVLTICVNQQRIQHRLGDLLGATQSHYLRGWLSEAIQIGPLVAESDCTFSAEIEDEPLAEVDRYRLEVRQRNGQCAWLSPIWAER